MALHLTTATLLPRLVKSECPAGGLSSSNSEPNKEENEDFFLCHQCLPGAECPLGPQGSGAGICLSVLGVPLCWLLLALPVGICIPEGGQDVEVEEAWALSLGLCCDWESQAAPSTNKQ